MNQITADESWLTRLRGLSGPAEIRDERGTLLGHFLPTQSPEELAAAQEKARKLFDLDKARETLEREGGHGRSLKEIWADLHARERVQ